MRNELDPIVGNWYRHVDKGQVFRVVALDDDRDVVDIQFFDGDLDAIEASDWPELDLELAEPPEDETGALDEPTEDLGASETAMSDRDWRESLESNRAEKEEWEDETPEDERDERDEGAPSEELRAEEDLGDGTSPGAGT